MGTMLNIINRMIPTPTPGTFIENPSCTQSCVSGSLSTCQHPHKDIFNHTNSFPPKESQNHKKPQIGMYVFETEGLPKKSIQAKSNLKL